MGVSYSGIHGAHEFPATSWSVIVNARDPDHPQYARTLHRLIELYWKPVYCVIRHARRCGPDDAKDLTQAFFTDVVLDRSLLANYRQERGSFRSLLRAAIANYLQDEARFRDRKKRGGGTVPLSLDGWGDLEPELGELPDARSLSPEQLFDLAWNEAVMSTGLSRLEARLAAEGKQTAFELFKRYDVDGESESLSYEALGRAAGLSVPQVKHALLLARGAFREIVTELVRGYVDDSADLAAELRHLFGA